MSKYLGKNEFLVKKNKIIIVDQENSKSTPNLADQLQSFILQKPNRKYFAVIPREYIYFNNKEKYSANKDMKGIVKHAEMPVIYDRNKMLETSRNIEKYLKFSRGFYYAKVFPKAIKEDHKAEIYYYVHTDFRYKIRSKEYFGQDTAIIEKIKNLEEESHLKAGVPIDEQLFDQEKNRIVDALHLQGFANFNSNYIEFAADSSLNNKEMDIFIKINSPKNDSIHRKFTIGDIKVYTAYKGKIDTIKNKSFRYKKIKYFYKDEMIVRTKTLDRAFFFYPGETYDKQKIQNTYGAINNIGTYRFINIVPTQDSKVDTILNYEVFLTPITEPWTFSGYLELFYTRSKNDLLGISISPSLSNINLLGGGEKFSSGLESSIEVSPTQGIRTINFKFNNNLSYPTILDPVGRFMYRNFLRIRNKGDKFTYYDNKTKTNLELSFNYNNQINLLKNTNIRTAYGYSTKLNNRTTHFFTPVGISFTNSGADPEFLANLKNPNFEKRLGKFFTTGFIFQEYNYLYSSPTKSKSGINYKLNFRVEQSGAEIFSLNKIFSPNKEWVIRQKNDSLKFSKFYLFDLQITGDKKLTEKHSIAGRLRTAMVQSFGNTSVPIFKQFQVGGANSLRAWRVRELGPGGHTGYINLDSIPYFQTGDLALEANLEYRFPVWGILEGAVFMDAGNIWSLDPGDTRTDARFKFNSFYKQIALGSGFGMRLNFSYLILRLDLGTKIRLPYYNETYKSYWVTDYSIQNVYKNSNLNLAINYPF